MFASKQNRTIITVSAIIIFLLIAFALLRDTSTPISLQKVLELVDDDKIEHVKQCDKNYYLQTTEGLYSIPATQITPEILQNYSIEVYKGNIYLVFIAIALVLFGSASYATRYWMKQREV